MNIQEIGALFAYNEWAMDRQLTAIRQLDDEQLNRQLVSSFTSIKETLLHIVSAEEIWVSRFLGETPAGMLHPSEFPDLVSVERQLGKTRAKWQTFLAGLDNGKLHSAFVYRNFAGEEIRLPLWQLLHHVANHATFHRGQLTTLLRQVGAVPPSTDALLFYRDASRS